MSRHLPVPRGWQIYPRETISGIARDFVSPHKLTAGTSLQTTENRLSGPFFAMQSRSLSEAAVIAQANAAASARGPSVERLEPLCCAVWLGTDSSIYRSRAARGGIERVHTYSLADEARANASPNLSKPDSNHYRAYNLVRILERCRKTPRCLSVDTAELSITVLLKRLRFRGFFVPSNE